jgi:pimeloyl-ACP methyl ester carboxylesterase
MNTPIGRRRRGAALRGQMLAATIAFSLILPGVAAAQVSDKGNPYASIDVSDATLVRELKGFRNGFANVNGTRLHYVEGGKGTPIVLLPGYPQTWWAFHKIMPSLAKNHTVIAVDIRGMGASDKPQGGYDKKNMARDISELLRSLGHEKAHIVGHDIGSQVAYAFAANFPDATISTTYLDVAALPASVSDLKLIPEKPLTDKWRDSFFLWWFAFNQVKGLPEELIEGRAPIYLSWYWRNLLGRQDALTERDRAVYAYAYNSPAGIRGGNAWYQAYAQDLKDNATYPAKLTGPTLGIGGLGNGLLMDFMKERLTNPELVDLKVSGHYVAEEEPDRVAALTLAFINKVDGASQRR